jgi:hypothetical protein
VSVGLAVAAPLPLYWLFNPETDYTFAGVVLSIVFILAATVIAVFSARDRFEAAVFGTALYFKLVASGVYLKLCYTVYRESDAMGYVNNAYAIIEGGKFQWALPSWSTNAIFNLTAALFGFMTPSITLGFCVFALIGFFGQMLLYRAFCIAAPNVERTKVAVMCFLFPSLVFWTSPIGKDAVVFFGLGLATFGAAKLFTGHLSIGTLVIGLLIVGIVRPHVASIYCVALAVTYLLFRRSTDLTAVIIKFVALPVLVMFAGWMTTQTQTVFRLDSIQGTIGRTEQIRSFTGAQGGSDFGYSDSLVFRLATSPALFFRPFPWEINNQFSALASAEGGAMLLLVWLRRHQALLLMRRWRAYPFIVLNIAFPILLMLSLSTVVNNLGTLVRQRAMAFPIFLVIVCADFRQSQPRAAAPARAVAAR